MKWDPDDFLGWPTLLEVMPPDDAQRDDVIRGVTSLMKSLIDRGLRVLAKGPYVEELRAQRDYFDVSAMNQVLICSIYVDTAHSCDETASLVAALA